MDVLELARSIVPDFPTSAGRPFRDPDPRLLAQRGEIEWEASKLDVADAMEVAARTWRVWMAARDVPGGRAFLRAVLDERKPPRSRWRALALYGDGLFAYWDGDPEGARRRNEDAAALAEELQDPEALLFANLGLSRVAAEAGDGERAATLAAEAHRLASDFDAAMEQAPLHMRAQAARLAGDYDTAAALFEQSLALNRAIDDPSMVPVELHNLGLVEIRRGNADTAERYFAELPPPQDPYRQALTRMDVAAVAFLRGDSDKARQLLADVESGDFASDDLEVLRWLQEQLAS
jgi:tetratricopeptide (TPR) repeat protein